MFLNLSKFKFLINLASLAIAVLVVVYVVTDQKKSGSLNIFQQETRGQNWDLSTTQGRETASIEKPISPYNVKKCGEVKHTDGEIMTFCVVSFNGTSGGFYDANKNLMVVGSFSEFTLIHEIFHAASIHNYKKGYTDMLGAQTQEKMAYDAENLLMQIQAFQDDLNITPDLSKEKKEKLGIPTEKVFASNLTNTNKINSSASITAKNTSKKTTIAKKVKL